VKLTVDGKSYTQPITVKQDPRVKTAALTMQTIYADTKAAYYGAIDAQAAAAQAQGLRTQIAAITPKPSGAVGDALTAFDKKLQDLIGAPTGGGGGGRGGGARPGRRRAPRRSGPIATCSARRPKPPAAPASTLGCCKRRALRCHELVPGRGCGANRESTRCDGRREEGPRRTRWPNGIR
jgi:hypothetical protein